MCDEQLNKTLSEWFGITGKDIESRVYNVNGLKILKLRDILIETGQICHEDLDKNLYVATIGAGFLRKNIAYMALQLRGNNLVISVAAKEGMIKQKTLMGAFDELEKRLEKYIEK